MITSIVNAVLGIPTCSAAYTYAATDVTGIGDELSSMLTAYFPAILTIFATLFALAVFYKLVRKWMGSRN